MHRGTGTAGELLGDIAALQARHDVKSVWPDNARHLLDGNICVSTEVRDVAGIVLVGKNQADGVAVLLQCLVGALNTRLEFFQRRHVLAIDCGRVLQYPKDFVQVLAVRFGRRSRDHGIGLVSRSWILSSRFLLLNLYC